MLFSSTEFWNLIFGVVIKSFKIFLLVALSFLTSFNLSANDTFFSIEKKDTRVYDVVNAGSDWTTCLGKNISELAEAPTGYSFYTANGKKWIRQVDASDLSTAKLTVKDGKIVKYADEITHPIFKTADDLALTFDKLGEVSQKVRQQAFDLFKEKNWGKLEKLFDVNNINRKWPPNNGFKNITHIKTGSELSGKTFDRFQIDENLGGGFASPVNTGEGVGDLVFTYDSRALKYQISEGTYYIKFKLKGNLPSDLKFEYGESIPWFNASGNADQIKSSYNFGNLIEGVDYDIIERLVYQNGQWVSIP